MQKTTKVVLGVLGVAVIGFFMFYFGNGDTFQGRLSKDLGKDSSRRTAQDEGIKAATDPEKDAKLAEAAAAEEASKLPNLVFTETPNATLYNGTYLFSFATKNGGAKTTDELAGDCAAVAVHASSNVPMLDAKGNMIKYDEFDCRLTGAAGENFAPFEFDGTTSYEFTRLAEGEEISDMAIVLDYYGVLKESNENDNTATVAVQ